MAWLLLVLLHLRATWAGLAYSGHSDLPGWALGQAFFLGVVILLALAGRVFPKAAKLMPLPVALLAFTLAVASWSSRVTGDTFRVFGAEAGKTRWQMLLSSAVSEADWLFAFDLLLALGASAAAFAWRRRVRPLSPRKAIGLAAAALVLVIAGAAREPKDPRLESPLLALLRSGGKAALPSAGARVADLRALRYGSVALGESLLRDLKQRRGALAEAGRRPNVVLIFMESTGSSQIRPGGKWDPALTPSIYALSQAGVLFPSVYAPFPGTVRAHLAVMTGGHMITWGSVYKELSSTYLSPTLPGELKRRGYRSGFFSAAFLDSENMDGFYERLPFDERLMPERMSARYKKEHAFNSWGIDDREVGARALAFAKQGPEPFFIAINFDATHHPYDVPKGFKKLRPGDDNRANFDNALHFLDSVAGGLVEGLKAAGLDDTIFVIMGDHGEAFGDLHPGNFTHRNFIYEENVRSFLLLADLKKRLAPLEAEFPASHGSVLPTVLDLVDQKDTPGSLFEPKPEIEYFYKNTHPELWGLRDGEWKFIAPMLEPKNAELFRLDQDPHEAHNLAARYPDRVREYRNLDAQWYLDTQNDFVSRLDGYKFAGGEGLKDEDLSSPGPKRLAFGFMDKDGKFQPAPKVSASAKIAVYTLDIPYPQGQLLLYGFLAPDGSKHSFTFFHKSEWSDVYAFPQASFRMGPGIWKLRIFDRKRELLSGQFEITP